MGTAIRMPGSNIHFHQSGFEYRLKRKPKTQSTKKQTRRQRRQATPTSNRSYFTSSYFTSTEAPTSTNFFLIASASSLLTPSLIGFGAPSTKSLASFSPRLVTSRTALITLILLAPAAVRMTENSVFSSTGAAAAAPPPAGAATATLAAAADTPSFSSNSFTSCDASSNVRP